MDEPTGQEKAKQASGEPEIISPATIPIIEEKHDDQPRTTPADKGAKQNAYIKIKTWLKELLNVHADRQVELVLAFAITFFALCQVVVMRSGSTQTDKLITAANRQASAAKSFATSAQGINIEIGNAEADFARLAGNSANSINNTQNAIRLDQRAWVYAHSFELSEEPKSKQTPIAITIGFTNSGRTPALDLVVKTRPGTVDGQQPPSVNWKITTGDLPKFMLPPGQIGFTAKTIPLNLDKGFDDYIAGKTSLYTQAKVTYKDIFGRRHWTTVCMLHHYGRPLNEFDVCGSGNSVDDEDQGHNKNPTQTLAVQQP